MTYLFNDDMPELTVKDEVVNHNREYSEVKKDE